MQSSVRTTGILECYSAGTEQNHTKYQRTHTHAHTCTVRTHARTILISRGVYQQCVSSRSYDLTLHLSCSHSWRENKSRHEGMVEATTGNPTTLHHVMINGMEYHIASIILVVLCGSRDKSNYELKRDKSNYLGIALAQPLTHTC